MFVSYQNFLRTLELHYKIFDNSHLKFGKREQAKHKKQHVRRPVLTSVGFLKCVDLQLFPEIQLRLCHFECQKGDQNSTALKKLKKQLFQHFIFECDLQTFIRAFENGLVKFVALVALKILDNLTSMQNSLNANNCGHK